MDEYISKQDAVESENMNKAKEISALWEQIKPQIGKLVGLCYEVEDHAEVTADAYQRGYENGFIAGHLKAEKSGQSFYEDGYQRGLNDAWEAARKIAYMYSEERKKVFGENLIRKIQDIYSASEAIEKIRQYEEKQEEIQVGDEVEAMAGNAVVIEVIDGGQTVRYMYPDTITGRNKACNVTRTGRNFPEIAEVLAKMKETDNG